MLVPSFIPSATRGYAISRVPQTAAIVAVGTREHWPRKRDAPLGLSTQNLAFVVNWRREGRQRYEAGVDYAGRGHSLAIVAAPSSKDREGLEVT
jgi:hypothetical protein